MYNITTVGCVMSDGLWGDVLEYITEHWHSTAITEENRNTKNGKFNVNAFPVI